MSRKRDWHPPWMTAEEWAEWDAGADERGRQLHERIKRLQKELEERNRAAQQQPQRRRRRLFGLR
ncbi:MAG: hypothetical protein ACRDON_13195 [Gaiellaceae bacterium]